MRCSGGGRAWGPWPDRPGAASPAVQAARPGRPRRLALTAAELRLLPLLATRLSLQDIAGQLSLSGATIKAQATSIYRKLGASSRSQAITRARDLGLLDGSPAAGADVTGIGH